jgi:hypothetical protein
MTTLKLLGGGSAVGLSSILTPHDQSPNALVTPYTFATLCFAAGTRSA